MKDEDCVRFLQSVLPRLHMRWPGFRKVRGQVCKRLQRRINALGLVDTTAYYSYLHGHDDEWSVLDYLCRITVSRFYRDRAVLANVQSEVLPMLARSAIDDGDAILRGWSAGCAMGEEAYTLLLIWDRATRNDYPRVDMEITGSDIDEVLLRRARRGCYGQSSLKALPEPWLKSCFRYEHGNYCLDANLRNKVAFINQDIREQRTVGRFHIIFCRNMAFTYFEESLQLEILAFLHNSLIDGGVLVIGGHEALPEGSTGFEHWQGQRAVYRKT